MLNNINLKNKKRFWLLIPFAILALLDSCTLLPIMFGALKHINSGNQSMALVVLSIVIYLILISISWYFYCKISHRPKFKWSEIIKLPKKYWKTIGFGFIGLILIDIITGVLENLLSNSKTITNSNELLTALDSSTIYKIGTILCSVLLASILEELLYRGILMRILSPRLSIYSIIISSLIFDVMHQGFNITSLILYGGSGLIYALIYKNTHSLKVSITLHSLKNFIDYLPLL